jgi:hypothetical protein
MKAPPGVEILGDKHIPVLSVAAPVSEAQEAATWNRPPLRPAKSKCSRRRRKTEPKAKPSRAPKARAGQRREKARRPKGEKAPAAKGRCPRRQSGGRAEKAGDKKAKK